MRRSPWLHVLVAVGVCSTARAQVFHGVVLDRETRHPVWIAAVVLVDYYNHVRAVAMTDSVGRYELAAPEPGAYRVRVDARGYSHAYSDGYIVQAGDTVEVNVLVTYEPDPPDARVVGVPWPDAWASTMARPTRGWQPVSRE